MHNQYDDSADSMNHSSPPTGAKTDLSISMAKANLYSVLFIIPIGLLAMLYYLVWGIEALAAFFREHEILKLYGLALLFFIPGIILHEWIHAFSWVYFSKKSFKTVKFGINWKALSPYAHCMEPMDVSSYRIGTMLPGIILGIVPYLIGLIWGNIGMALFGLVFLLAASGDAIILWKLRKVKKNCRVEDHPSRAGCFVLEE